MEILDQIEERITKAIQTIETLQARVRKLEQEKGQYEEKLSALLAHLDRFDDPKSEVLSQPEPAGEENFGSKPSPYNDSNNAEHHHF